MENINLVKHSYKDDCIFLLKDLTDKIQEITIQEKEELIRSGVSYSEMISKESIPSKDIKNIFLNILNRDKKLIAYYVAKISEIIYRQKGNKLVIVSLARAGTPYGILIRKYLKLKYKVDIPHYSISIIRDKGIDSNALKYILSEHREANIQFVDGWTGKGSITKELNKSIDDFNNKNKTNIDSSLALRVSNENPYVQAIYDKYLDYPMSHKAHELLHTKYFVRVKNPKKEISATKRRKLRPKREVDEGFKMAYRYRYYNNFSIVDDEEVEKEDES